MYTFDNERPRISMKTFKYRTLFPCKSIYSFALSFITFATIRVKFLFYRLVLLEISLVNMYLKTFNFWNTD